ncbi:hypothetical protein BC826DRAFT_960512 [Russula brevipes]|nr:hypothetical protein BC826DRAFT_960512 [Russula brevipes]
MLKRFSKILAFNVDNATSNDKQTVTLHTLPNSFDQVNHICCFNHTMQLSAKRLLKPLTLSTTANNTEDNSDVSQPMSDADIMLTYENHQDYVSLLVGTCASMCKREQAEKAGKINSSARQVPISKKL